MRLVDVAPDAPLAPGVYRLYFTPTSTAGRVFLRSLPAWAWRIATEWGNQPENGRLVFLDHLWDGERFVVRVQVIEDAELATSGGAELVTAGAPAVVAVTAVAVAAGLVALWGIAATLSGVAREVVDQPAGVAVIVAAGAALAALLLGRSRRRT